jgi:hypothetical protein
MALLGKYTDDTTNVTFQAAPTISTFPHGLAAQPNSLRFELRSFANGVVTPAVYVQANASISTVGVQSAVTTPVQFAGDLLVSVIHSIIS